MNNNIVLIDTYNRLRAQGHSPEAVALRTGAQRLRPLVLPSVTTALGLMPMVIGLNLNFFTRETAYGAPSSQWRTELSSAIAGGLVIADRADAAPHAGDADAGRAANGHCQRGPA